MARSVKTFRVKEEAEPVENHVFEFEFIPAEGSTVTEAMVSDKGNGVRHLTAHGTLVEQFEAYGRAPVGATLAMSSMIRYGARGRRDIDMNGMMEFFERAMPSEDYQRMRDLFDDPKWTIDIDLVGEVFTWLTEEYSDRPTKRSRRSSRTGPDGGRSELGVVIPLDDSSVEESS